MEQRTREMENVQPSSRAILGWEIQWAYQMDRVWGVRVQNGSSGETGMVVLK